MGAMEAIKVISGIGEPLTGRLVRLDLRDMEFQTSESPNDDPTVPFVGTDRE